jgi:hypothetical protein
MLLCHSPQIHGTGSGIVIDSGKTHPEQNGSGRNNILPWEDE